MNTEDKIKKIELALLRVISSLNKLGRAMNEQLEEDYEYYKNKPEDKAWADKRYKHTKEVIDGHEEALNDALDLLEGK